MISGLGSFFGGKSAAKAAEAAWEKQRQALLEDDRVNYNRWLDSRGANGDNVFLPFYMDGEAKLGKQAMNFAEKSLQDFDPQSYIDEFNGDILPLTRAAEGANNLIGDLYSGELKNRRQASLKPVKQARISAAESSMSGIDQALDETLASINAAEARKGFYGGSGFRDKQMLRATTGARQGAAETMSAARLQNAIDDLGLDESDISMMFQNFDQPIKSAALMAQLKNLPYAAASDRFNSALAPLNFFRISEASPVYRNVAAQNPAPMTSNTGMLVGGATNAVGQAVGDFFGTQAVLQALKGSGSGGSSFNSGNGVGAGVGIFG